MPSGPAGSTLASNSSALALPGCYLREIRGTGIVTENNRLSDSDRDGTREGRSGSARNGEESARKGVDHEFEDLLGSLSEAMESTRNGGAREGDGASRSKESEGADTDAPAASEDFASFYPSWLDGSNEPPADEDSGAHAGAQSHMTEGAQAAAGTHSTLPRRRHVYRSHESSRLPPHGFRCQVKLVSQGQEYVGAAEGAAVPGARADIAARATLDAVVKAEGKKVVLSLMAARVLRFVDLPVVIVAVYALNEEEVKRLVGGAIVENSEEQAAILATLQAVERWVSGAVSR